MAENIEDKMPVEGSRCALQDWLEKKAEGDAQLRGRLLSNSQATLENLAGKRMPAGIKIGILEESPQQLYLVGRYEGAMEPYGPGTSQGQFLSRSLHALALGEDDFWSKVKGDPKRILAERLALALAEQVKVQVLEEDSGTAYFVLHHDDHYRGWKPSAEVMQKVRIKPPGQVAKPPPVPPPPPAQAAKR